MSFTLWPWVACQARRDAPHTLAGAYESGFVARELYCPESGAWCERKERDDAEES